MNIEDILSVRTIDEYNALLDTYGRGRWIGVKYGGHQYNVYSLDAQITVFAGPDRGYMKMYRGRGKNSGTVVFAAGMTRRNGNGRTVRDVKRYPTAMDAFSSIN